MGLELVEAVIVTEDRAGPDIGLLAHRAVAQIAEVIGLGARPDLDLLDLDEVADVGVGSDVRAGPQAGIGADQGPLAHDRAFQMAEGLDHRAGGDADAGPEDHELLDGDAGGDLGVPGQVDRLRRGHGDALDHQGATAALLPDRLGGGQFGLRVDALHRGFRREGRAGRQASPMGDADHVGQVVFAVGVVVADRIQDVEQSGAVGGQNAGIAVLDLPDAVVGVLGLDDAQQHMVRGQDQAAIGAGVGGLEAQHRDVGARGAQVEQRRDRRGAQQRAVGEGHHHVAVEIGQGLAGGQHGVAGAQRRILDDHRRLTQPLAGVDADGGAVGPDHDDDPRAAQGLGGVDGVVQQGPAGDLVQHLGGRRLHPRALAGGEDHGGPGAA
jgi:hypothetical protein